MALLLTCSVSNAHPYSRLNTIAGTKGIFKDYPPRIYFDGQAGEEEYGGIDQYKAQYEHPLWKKQGDIARKLGGHGGMDFIECYRLTECLRKGLVPDLDVYDAAAWSAPGTLSAQSLGQGSAPQKFPDFTRGKWRERKGSAIAETERPCSQILQVTADPSSQRRRLWSTANLSPAQPCANQASLKELSRR
jgi:hypothetical protein